MTSRYKAEYGRSNGGVMNIVTKSGTNDMHGSWFTLFRDESMNAHDRDSSEELHRTPTSRTTAAISSAAAFGGPIVHGQGRTTSSAFERTQQDTFQVVNTRGLFPKTTAPSPTPYRENLFTGKVTCNLTPSHYLTVRYGRNTN